MTNAPITDIRDIKGLVPLPISWWWIAALIAVLVVGAVAFWLWKRRKPMAATGTVALPNPFEVAVEALRKLREQNPPVEEFYNRLSSIVRQYLEDQFALRAPERTTEEFLYEVSSNGSLIPDHKELLARFLQESDLVKFARLQPEPADRQRAFEAAEKFVTETGWRASLPASRESEPAARLSTSDSKTGGPPVPQK